MIEHKEFNELLSENMTEEGFRFWKALEAKIPNIWDRLSSSSKRYHKKSDGRVNTILEHTYEMLYAGCKIMRLFGVEKKTKEADTLILGILLHDSLKYGTDSPLYVKYTTSKHDKLIADTIYSSKKTFLKLLTENQVDKLEQMTRYHSGMWSTDADKEFTFSKLNPETFFLHVLDMLSANDCLKVPISNGE